MHFDNSRLRTITITEKIRRDGNELLSAGKKGRFRTIKR